MPLGRLLFWIPGLETRICLQRPALFRDSFSELLAVCWHGITASLSSGRVLERFVPGLAVHNAAGDLAGRQLLAGSTGRPAISGAVRRYSGCCESAKACRGR